MIACPANGGLGQLVQIARRFDLRCLLVMIALHDRAIHRLHPFDAFVRIGIVTDNIAEADKVGASLLGRVVKDGFERLEIGVNITENCASQHVVKALKG